MIASSEREGAIGIESGRPLARNALPTKICVVESEMNVFKMNSKENSGACYLSFAKRKVEKSAGRFSGFDGDGDNPRRWDNLQF